ncbi:Uncharacterised protein [Klebsiella pneumoniae]|nr:Uncharacterised protein [Klebsiella pneumoniae]SXZ22143.1 Uncharacterised protein [Klebsiella pneumoniae]SXZ54016.1 Uncharacterised protein [Klebsiella pneumoniae]SYA43673.1 Uncharacterised protein [Klebsiella pneumoniae]
MMSLWDALRMNMMISYQELVRTFLNITLRLLRNKTGYLLVGKNFRGCVFNSGW